MFSKNAAQVNMCNKLKYYYLFSNKMIFMFTLLSLLFSPSTSLKEINPKLCINCKYFIEDSKFGKFGKFNKCSLFPKDTNGGYLPFSLWY